MRCSWKLAGLLAVVLSGFTNLASAAERSTPEGADEESPAATQVEPADDNEVESLDEQAARQPQVRQRPVRQPSTSQPKSTSKSSPATVKKIAPSAKTLPVTRSADRSVTRRTTGMPEVRSMPAQPAARMELPRRTGGRPSDATKSPESTPATRSPASRVRTKPPERMVAESTHEVDAQPAAHAAVMPKTLPAGPTPRDSVLHSTHAAARTAARTAASPAAHADEISTLRTAAQRSETESSETQRTDAKRRTVQAVAGGAVDGAQPSAVQQASARRTIRTTPTSRAAHSREVVFDEREVQNADYHEPNLATRHVMEPPLPTPRRGGGWRMAAVQPAAPRQSAPTGFANSDGPAVMEEIEGEMRGPVRGPMYGTTTPSWLQEDDLGCDDCVSGTCGPSPRRWSVTGGIEALIVRPHFSDAQGILTTTSTQGSNSSEIREDSMNYDFSYTGSFRMYAGIRNCACGDEFRFSYWNFGGHESQRCVATTTTSCCDFLCNLTSQAGDRMSQRVGLNVNVFDLDMFKPFYFGQSSCGGCESGGGGCDSGGCESGDCGSGDCGDCGDSCEPCCPVWDLRWLGGFRFASVNHGLDSQIITTGEVLAAAGQSRATYFGVGPRMGLQGRRYFGDAGRLSVYAKGTGSLLVGTYEQNLTNFNITPVPTNSFSTSSSMRVVPVAELEVGGSWRLTPKCVLTGGWLVQSWWDLGLQEIMSNNDDANILGFDGFFARAEMVF